MSKKSKNFLNIGIMIILMIITLYVIFKNNDLEDVINQIKGGNYKLLLLAALMMLFSLLCESTIIYIILKIKKENIHFLRCAKYSFIGFYYCAITPSASGGQPAQILYMKKDGYKITTSSVIIFTMVTVYKFVLLLFVGLTFLFNHSFVVNRISHLKFFYIFGVTLNVLFIVFIWLVLFFPQIIRYFINLICKLLSKFKLLKKSKKIIANINTVMDDYIESADFIKNNLYVLIPALFFTILQRFLMFSISYVVYRFFELDTYSFFDILTLQVILNTSIDVLPVPGGIGASEVGFKLLFETVYGELLLIPAMLVTRFINFYYMLILSAIISLSAHFLMIRNDFRKEDIS